MAKAKKLTEVVKSEPQVEIQTQPPKPQTRPRKVLIATPSLDGKVTAEYAMSLLYTVQLCKENNIEVSPLIIAHDALIQRVRNDLLANAVLGEFDDVIFADSDQEWAPEWVLRLLSHPVDVIGFPVIRKADDEMYNVKAKPMELIPSKEGICPVESVGTGFIRLSKKACLALWEKGEVYTEPGSLEKRWVFETAIIDNDLVSEDVVLCKKLKEAGFQPYIDIACTCAHIGTKKWYGNFANFIQRLQKSIKEQEILEK